jgi:hypothetical protein
VAQAGGDRLAAHRAVGLRQRRHCAARSDLQIHPVGLLPQGGHAVGETDGVAQMGDPVVGTGRLGIRQHLSRSVGDDRDLWRRKLHPGKMRAEGGKDAFQHLRMRRDVDGDAGGVDVVGLEAFREVLEPRVGAGNDGQFRRVDGRNVEIAEVRLQRGFGEGDRQHPARRHRVEKLPAQANEADGGFQRHHARDTGGGVFAHAVPDQHGGPDAPAFPQLRQGYFDDQDQRQLLRGATQCLGSGGLLPFGGEPERAGLGLGVAEGGEAPVHPFGEDGFGLVQIARHVRVLRAAAGEHEDHVGAVAQPALGEDAAGIACLQHLRGFRVAFRHQHAAVFKGAAAVLQGPGHIGKGLIRMGAQMGGETRGSLAQGRLAAGGEGDELERPVGGFRDCHHRRLLHDDEGVRAAHAQRVHPGAARTHPARPVGQLVVHPEGAALEINRRVRYLEVEAGRHLAVVQRERRLDQACDACGGVEMADVRLDAADPRKALGVGRAPEGLGQGGHLDGVAQIGPGPVAFDVIHRFRRGARHRQRSRDAGGLTLDRGGKIARFCRAVVVDRRPFDDGPDVVAVGQGIIQSAQENRPRARAEDRALRPVIEGVADAVGRQDFALFIDVAATLRQVDGHTPRKRHVAFAVQQCLDRVMGGDQRGRAGGLQAKARPLQVEDMADAGRQEILVVAGMAQQEHPRAIHKGGVRAEVEVEVAAHAAAREDADPTPEAFGRVAGIFQGFPGDFQELTVLRVKDCSLFRGEAEEFGIEAVEPFQQRRRRDVVRVAQGGGAFARGKDFLLAQPPDSRPTVPQILPIGLDIRR